MFGEKNVLRVVLKIYDKKGVISYFIWTSSAQGHGERGNSKLSGNKELKRYWSSLK